VAGEAASVADQILIAASMATTASGLAEGSKFLANQQKKHSDNYHRHNQSTDD
jgi:hypothetical protein